MKGILGRLGLEKKNNLWGWENLEQKLGQVFWLGNSSHTSELFEPKDYVTSKYVHQGLMMCIYTIYIYCVYIYIYTTLAYHNDS